MVTPQLHDLLHVSPVHPLLMGSPPSFARFCDTRISSNNGLLTVYPPSGSSPVKNYKIKYEIYKIKSNNIGL